MFIERSSARIRAVRTLFVLLGLIPCACLCGWAALRHSTGHRHAIERRCEQLLGLPVRIERVEHLRPDALRLRGCELASPAGDAVLTVPVVDVESSATEVRVRLGRVECTERLTRVLAALAQQWLRQPARFSHDCVVDVGAFSWSTSPRSTSPVRVGGEAEGPGFEATGLRIECVAASDSRAVRVSRHESADPAAVIDEIRVIATTAVRSGEVANHADVRLEVAGAVARPVPVGMLEAFAGFEVGSFALGADAVASGRIDAACEAGRWNGAARGRVERIDLADAAAHLPYRMSGDASLAIERLEWMRGRITACDAKFSASRGMVEQRLLDALVSTLGCRPGPAFRSAVGEQARAFDEAAGRLRIDASGIDLRAATARTAALAVVRGAAILEDPPTAVPLGRVAWLLSPPAAVPVPASPATGWLLGVFSEEILAGEAGGPGVSRASSDQAGRPTRRSDF